MKSKEDILIEQILKEVEQELNESPIFINDYWFQIPQKIRDSLDFIKSKVYDIREQRKGQKVEFTLTFSNGYHINDYIVKRLQALSDLEIAKKGNQEVLKLTI